MEQPLLQVKHLKTYFPVKQGFLKQKAYIKAVDDVSFSLERGETLGIVGESGCGKSTMGRSILRLIEPTSGEVKFEGNDLTTLSAKEMRKMRKNIQIVFQDPYASLNPRMTVASILEEALVTHRIGANSKERREKIGELLQLVGLNRDHAERYPHEFSGGQRQRIGIARAIAINPALIVADEPVSALDVSIQAQILNLFQDLQTKLNIAYIFIAHDLSVVKHISDKIGVMYLGKMVEFATKEELFANPLHPYTKALMSAIPVPNPKVKQERIILKGDLPSPMNPPLGCVFHTRCEACMEVCKTVKPQNREITPGRFVACHLYDPELNG